jgi:hypothetical protein
MGNQRNIENTIGEMEAISMVILKMAFAMVFKTARKQIIRILMRASM